MNDIGSQNQYEDFVKLKKKKPEVLPYVYAMLAGFGAISLSVLFFFAIYRFQGFSGALNKLFSLLSPFIYGLVFAYLIKPVCNRFETLYRWLFKGKREKLVVGLAIASSMLTAALIIYLLLIMIIPQLAKSIISLAISMPRQFQTFSDNAVAWFQNYIPEDSELFSLAGTSYDKIVSEITTWTRTTLIPYMRQVLNGIGEGVWNFVLLLKNLIIGFIVAVYLLGARHRYSHQARMVLYSIVKRDWADKLMEEFRFADKAFGGFISGKLVDSAIIGVICYIFTVIFSYKNALLISTIIGVTNIIPFFGPFIGAIPSVFLIMIDNPIKALWFTVFVIVLQQFDGNILGPKILGDSTGLSSFWVLFSIMLFGGLWGFIGMIIGVPLFAVIYDILRRIIFRGLHRHKCDDMLLQYNRLYGDDQPAAATADAAAASAEPVAAAASTEPAAAASGTESET